MKGFLIIDFCIFSLGLFLYMMDDPYIPEAKLLGSSYGTKIIKFSFILLILFLYLYSLDFLMKYILPNYKYEI